MLCIPLLLAPIKIENTHFKSELRAYQKGEEIKEYNNRLDLIQALLEQIDRELHHAEPSLEELYLLRDESENIMNLLDSMQTWKMDKATFVRWKSLYVVRDSQDHEIRSFIDQLERGERSELRLRQAA